MIDNEITQLGVDIANISKLLSTLPPVPHQRGNIFEIAGFPSREQVTSNMLAFYLGDDEHCFGRNLLDALLNIIARKTDLHEFDFQTDYTIERESNYIDILVQAKTEDGEQVDWTIIIENKIYASLYNDLPDYWKRVSAKAKIGVVLSLYDLSEDVKRISKNNFVNITHKELIDEWITKLGSLFMMSDDRHLLYLKDYIQNIQSHYKNQQMDNIREEKMRVLQQNSDVLDKIMHAENDAKQYAVQVLNDTMRSFKFDPYTETWKANGKHFFPNERTLKDYPALQYLRFWFFLPDLPKYNCLTVYFELYGEGSKYGAKLRKKIQESTLPAKMQVVPGSGGGTNSGYCHLYAERITHYWC